MNRRNRIATSLLALLALPALLGALWSGHANAGALDLLSSKDASSGLRAALGQGIDTAVAEAKPVLKQASTAAHDARRR